MKSATSAARSVRVLARVLVAVSVTALVWVIGPSRASAASSGSCVDSYWAPMLEEDLDKGRASDCTPGASVIPSINNTNLVRPTLDTTTNHHGNENVGGPVRDYINQRETMRQGKTGPAPNSIAEYAQQWADAGGEGLQAGYTPQESTGQFIQRKLQPLRDHHVNVWQNTTWTNPSDDHFPTRYDSDIWTATFGADMPILNEDLLFGVFGSFTHSDVDTGFNNGQVDSKLGTIGPYASYTLNQYVAFDMTVAGIFGKHENVVGPAGPGSTPNARGKQDVDGFFVSMNANANYWIGNWGMQGRVGFLHSDMETEAYDLRAGGGSVRVPKTNNELTQIALASQVNYFMDGLPKFEKVKAMPFFRFTWNLDVDHDNIQLPFGVDQHPNDDDEIVVNWGVTLFGDSAFSGSIEGGRTLARKEFESWSVSGTVNYAF